MANTETQKLIRELDLQPHPEGGYYREVYRAPEKVRCPKGDRSAATIIYFLLPEGAVSRFHRVRSDEMWFFLDGAPLRLHVLGPDLDSAEEAELGPMRAESGTPLHVVQAQHWQAAESAGDWSLVSCVVAPGFEFADFELLESRVEAAAALRERYPALARFV